jgi:hypothetical protein
MYNKVRRVIGDESPRRRELKAQFVDLRARGISYSNIAKRLKVANGN